MLVFIAPPERIEDLRAQAAELLRFATTTNNADVRRILQVEAYDRADKALALEEWLDGKAQWRTHQQELDNQAG